MRACCFPVSPSARRAEFNATVQGGVRYGAAVSNLFDQLVLADDPICILDKVDQQIEDLRLHVNLAVRPSELPPIGINQKIIELKQQIRLRSGCSEADYQRI
jgi:hypothetical protein